MDPPLLPSTWPAIWSPPSRGPACAETLCIAVAPQRSRPSQASRKCTKVVSKGGVFLETQSFFNLPCTAHTA